MSKYAFSLLQCSKHGNPLRFGQGTGKWDNFLPDVEAREGNGADLSEGCEGKLLQSSTNVWF